jgi:hypothetical protein
VRSWPYEASNVHSSRVEEKELPADNGRMRRRTLVFIYRSNIFVALCML